MKRLFPFLLLITIFIGGSWAQDKLSAQRMALRELMQRSDAGDPKALYELARVYETGFDSIPVDSAKSLSLYKLSAQKGYPPAMNYVGFSYYNGSGVKQNTDSALYWIRSAADKGDVTAAANLGFLLTEGKDLEPNEEEAVKWITIAAEAGVPGAQTKLVELMEEIWQTMPLDSVVQLGINYYTGSAPVPGVRLLEIAARQNNPKALALLGDAYSKGIGVPYNHQKSIDNFYKAALEGDPSAQFILAELLEIFPDILKNTTTEDLEEEFYLPSYWYTKAAEAGITDSESAYQRLYLP